MNQMFSSTPFGAARMGLRAWSHGLQQPFYVPKELQPIQLMLSEGRVCDATKELWNSATMGSGSAAATLGYMCLACGDLSGINSVAAMQLCSDSANRGNSYAQYVMAWREYEVGNYRALGKWMNRSAQQRFSPAICDLGRLTIEGPLRTGFSPKVAIKFFRLAFRAGHLLTVMFFFRYCKEGKFGFVFKLLGTVALPIAHCLISPITWCYPFYVGVFAYPASRKSSLFQQINSCGIA